MRFVGYGLDNATTQTGGGIKRATTTTLTDHTSLLLHFSDGTHETCNGDSGGPAFMTIGGRETIVGLTSYGDVAARPAATTRASMHSPIGLMAGSRRADPGFGNEYATVPLRWHADSPDVVRDADAPLVGGRGRRWGELRFF